MEFSLILSDWVPHQNHKSIEKVKFIVIRKRRWVKGNSGDEVRIQVKDWKDELYVQIFNVNMYGKSKAEAVGCLWFKAITLFV